MKTSDSSEYFDLSWTVGSNGIINSTTITCKKAGKYAYRAGDISGYNTYSVTVVDLSVGDVIFNRITTGYYVAAL